MGFWWLLMGCGWVLVGSGVVLAGPFGLWGCVLVNLVAPIVLTTLLKSPDDSF